MDRTIVFFTLAAVFCLSGRTVSAYFITVDAHDEECFFDKVTSGTKLTLMFEVAEGGFLDIDVKIFGPEGKQLYQGDRESHGRYTFAAHMDGDYRYCFSNRMSTMTPKTIMFSMDIGEKGGNWSRRRCEQGQARRADFGLVVFAQGHQHEQEYMEVREQVHRAINDSTNSRVVLWSFFEALVLVAMTVGQVFYLKRFFEVRRVV